MMLEDEMRAADERYSGLIEGVRRGAYLSDVEQRDLTMWLLVRHADYLLEISQRLSAPSEIPSELPDRDG
jgi:hypothetical protein